MSALNPTFPGEVARLQSGTSRRRFVMAGVVGAAHYTSPGAARAAAGIVLPTTSSTRRFSILYRGDPVGTHTVRYTAATGETAVHTDIRLLVKVGFFTAFSFTHKSSETWRTGRLISLQSETTEHGEKLQVNGKATPQGFRVVSKGGPFIAAASTLTSNSLWTPRVLEQDTVVDAQHGGIIGVSARRFADEQIVIAGRRMRVTRYTLITPYLAGSIWYDDQENWVRGEFERDGSKIEYRLDN